MPSPPSLSAAVNQLLDPHSDLAATLDRHFSQTFRQRADGVWIDRAEFADRMARLRSVLVTATVEVHEELSDGEVYAERHKIVIDLVDRSRVRTEVFVFGRHTPDGRFSELQELTLSLPADDAAHRGVDPSTDSNNSANIEKRST